MSEERRKLWLYLYPDEPHQKAAIDTIDTVPQRQRPDYFRDSLVAGIALSKVDKRLPTLLALLLDDGSDIHTMTRVLRLVVPELDAGAYGERAALVAVAWQKRIRDVLQQGQPWTAWFAIGQEEYNQLVQKPESDIQVRALLATSEDTVNRVPASPVIQQYSSQKNISETFSNAKKMFCGSSDAKG